MSLAAFIARYGLAAVGLGAAIEGETVVMAAGVVAHEHLLALSGVVISAALGSFIADQACFAAGRHFRDWPIVQRTLNKPAAHRVMALIEHHPNSFIPAIRFLYGIRTLSPIAVGTSTIGRWRFMALDGLAAIVWAVFFAGIGYGLGDRVMALFRHLHARGPMILGALAAVIAILIAVRMACGHFHHRKPAVTAPA